MDFSQLRLLTRRSAGSGPTRFISQPRFGDVSNLQHWHCQPAACFASCNLQPILHTFRRACNLQPDNQPCRLKETSTHNLQQHTSPKSWLRSTWTTAACRCTNLRRQSSSVATGIGCELGLRRSPGAFRRTSLEAIPQRMQRTANNGSTTKTKPKTTETAHWDRWGRPPPPPSLSLGPLPRPGPLQYTSRPFRTTDPDLR